MKQLIVNHTEKLAMIDDEDFERLSKFKWMFRKSDASSNGKVCHEYNNGLSRTVPLANEVMKDYRSMFDHKDIDPFNNQKNNLRVADRFDNAQNKGKQRGTYSSKYKGVYYNKTRNKWEVSIWSENKRTYVGSFSDEIEAAKAYNEIALKLHGQFACLNPIP